MRPATYGPSRLETKLVSSRNESHGRHISGVADVQPSEAVQGFSVRGSVVEDREQSFIDRGRCAKQTRVFPVVDPTVFEDPI